MACDESNVVVLVVKHVPDFKDTSVADLWRPRWKVAQDYINLCFLEEVTAGVFAPRVYGYSKEQNMLAIEDVGQTSLRDREISEPGVRVDG